MNLFLNYEIYTNGLDSIILDIFSIFSVISAILIIISKNPIISVLFLIGLFITISLYLISIGMTFIGLSYLLVYVGAVSILFLFILMLINIRISELLSETRNSIPLVLIITVAFSTVLPSLIHSSSYIYNNINKILDNNSNVFYTLSNNWDNNLVEYNNITSIGSIMYTTYSMWLIITSIILLLAMVGAIVITIKGKN